MKYAVFPFLLLALFPTGCRPSGRAIPPKEDRPIITQVEGDDREINAAIKIARQTLPDFVKALQHPNPAMHNFSVKAEFKYPNGSEYMWIAEPTWDGKIISGTLMNPPHWVKTLKQGDKVYVLGDKISDWIYIENGKLAGGYTIRVLRKRMSPIERQQAEAKSGFKT